MSGLLLMCPDGMRIPLAGEVEWILPEGPQPYWRGEILDIEYDLRETLHEIGAITVAAPTEE